MVAAGMLQNPKVVRWLGGLVPAWKLLDLVSLNALRKEPSAANTAIRLADDLGADELARSAVVVNTLLLLRRAVDAGGLKLTATGNLSRAVVGEMREVMSWPDYVAAETLRLNRVVNEPDFLPLHVVRTIAETCRLVRRHRGKLVATRLGRQMMAEEGCGALMAVLFHVTFWHADFAYFSRGLPNEWPQDDVGIALWSLSVAAADWQSREALTRQSTIPNNAILEAAWDAGSMATEARILRPLVWFGLLEARAEGDESAVGRRYAYRKAPLFDRFLSFDVQLEHTDSSRH